MGKKINIFSGSGWRLVHNNKKVIIPPFFSTDITQTAWEMEIFITEEACIDRIIELDLDYAPLDDAKQQVNDYFNS